MTRAVLFALSLALCACRDTEEVVVYVSHDQVFSEPILRDFERETGITVRAVYDTEEAKGTGVMNRLLAERENPQADVYWANEPIRADLLRQEGITEPYLSSNAESIPVSFRDPDGHWTGFAARARVLIVHDDVPHAPDGIFAYVDPQWRGRGVIGNPLFGTTSAQMAALASLWGVDSLATFLDNVRANETAVSTSNGESADLVAQGAFAFSLVDVDDAVSRERQGRPVHLVFPDQGADGVGMLLLPNAVMLIRGAPDPEAGRMLVDYLLSEETERKLAASDAAQIPLHAGVPAPDGVPTIEGRTVTRVDYGEVARLLPEIQPMLQRWVDQVSQ